MSLNWERDPVQALSILLHDKESQPALAAARRRHPNSTYLDPEKLSEITDTGRARIYYTQIARMVDAYGRNYELFQKRKEETRERVSLLVDTVLLPLSDFVERPMPEYSPKLFIARKTPGEMLEWTGKKYDNLTEQNEEFHNQLGIPLNEGINIEGVGWMSIFQSVDEELQRGILPINARLGLNDEFLVYASNQLNSGLFNSGILGVGEFESPLTEKLIKAYHKVLAGIAVNEAGFADYEKRVGPEKVAMFVRSRDEEVRKSKQLATQLTITEGVLTILQTLNMMVAIKQPGYESNQDRLVIDLIDKGLVDRFARKISYSGIIGPMSIRGLVIIDMLQQGEGGIELSRDLEIKLASKRRLIRDARLMQSLPNSFQAGEDYMSFGGCPVAFSEGDEPNSVRLMAEVFKKAYISI